MLSDSAETGSGSGTVGNVTVKSPEMGANLAFTMTKSTNFINKSSSMAKHSKPNKNVQTSIANLVAKKRIELRTATETGAKTRKIANQLTG